MNIAVFDTYATTHNGAVLHFDVLVPLGSEPRAEEFARQWLAQIGLAHDAAELQTCRYCHNEIPQPGVLSHLLEHEYYILQMEGCPDPE